MVVLGVETSCDETACSIVSDGKLLSNIISSSVPFHEKFGGVIPEIASRFHIEYIQRVANKALRKARKKISDIDLIAVTESPGLPGSLVAGVSFAKAFSYSLDVPLVYVDHIKAHLYANFLTKEGTKIKFPFLGVVVSGGHTNIFIAKSISEFKLIGQTKDDAIGEAFDKVAKILGIGYPGGPKIEKFAERFKNKDAIKFPRAYLDKNSYDFSLSGIKTAVFYYARKKKITRGEIAKVSWSFQEAVFEVLIERITRACKNFKIKNIVLGGGVLCNNELRKKLGRVAKKLEYNVFHPPKELCLDNAAMVAGLGEVVFKKRGR